MAQIGSTRALEDRTVAALALSGQSTASELTERLQVSQPTFSRLVERMGDRLLVVGRARATRYMARRTIEGVGDRTPIYELDVHGQARLIATLHHVLPEAFYVEAKAEDVESAFYPDLPYFMNELRPSGFLGRLIPRRHPELYLPPDVRVWSADHVLRYVTRLGWNLMGAFIVGDEAFQLYLAYSAAPPDLVEGDERARRYPELARAVLTTGVPGSSAAGEQPKFLVTRMPGTKAVLVKFSAQEKSALGRRQADLLVAEHLAHRVLTKHGRLAARSELVVSANQTFLEVERFDRTMQGGRRGLLSLLALDAEFVGRQQNWTDSVQRLAELGRVPAGIVEEVRWLELFGKLIANNDMHAGNLSFFMRGSRVEGLAPCYDMLPAFYAGQSGHLGNATFAPPPPSPSEAAVWDGASRAALEFWRELATERRVSADFRRVARENQRSVEGFRKLARLLPAQR